MICGTYPPDVCGVADYTLNLAQRLRAEGVDARIVTSAGRDENACMGVPSDALVRSWDISGVRSLVSILIDRSPDVVHIQFPTEPFYGKWGINLLPWFLKKSKASVVTTIHEYCMAPVGGRIKQVLMSVFSDKVITTNHLDYSLISRWVKDRACVIPIGSNIEKVGSAEAGNNLAKMLGAGDSPFFMFFGFVRQGKGLEELIKAFNKVCEGRECRLLIVSGAGDPVYIESLRLLADRLGITHKIIWAGYRPPETISSLLLAASGVVLPFEDGATFRRGSLLAALTHERPIITTSSRTTPSDLVHGENCLLSVPGNYQALASNMSAILSAPGLAERLRIGSALLARDFDWKTIAEKTIKVYESVLPKSEVSRTCV